MKQSGLGIIIAQRITSALAGEGIEYDRLAKLVYGELSAIAADQRKGDWLEFPNGTTYNLTFKPSQAR